MKQRLVRNWLLALMVVLMSFSTASALYVEIGSGTENQREAPVNGWYKWGWSATIYQSADIGGAININALGYNIDHYHSSNTAAVLSDVTIYMKNTSESSFHSANYLDPSDSANGFTEVFNGTINYNGMGWQSFDLNTSFAYNGTDNLMIYFQDNNGGFSINHPYYVSSLTTNMCIEDHADGTAGMPTDGGTVMTKSPNVRLHYLDHGTPAMPSTPSPIVAAVNIMPDTVLSWVNGVDTDNVDVYLSNDETLVTNMDASVRVLTASTETSYDPTPDLNWDTTYYWRVVANNGNVRLTTPGAVWHFTTDFGIISAFPWDENFDHSTETPSGWTQPTDRDDADWRFGSITPSSNTGADADHTSGNGNFAFIEATGNINKRHHLITPTMDFTGLTIPMLKFWYHMHGETIASLNVDVFDVNTGTWTDNVMTRLEGEQGEEWLEKTVDLSAYTNTKVKIRFRGLTGTNGYSDICIDDVWIGEAPTTAQFTARPSSIDFGDSITMFTGSIKKVTISNSGSGTLTINQIEITGADVDEFSVIGNITLPNALVAGETLEVFVAFAPNTTGIKNANLAITDDLTRTINNVPLTGNGIATSPAISVFPWSENFDNSTNTPTDWIQPDTDDYNWEFGTRTPSAATGASADHTSGTGNFAFTEASGHLNKRFDLVTPVIDASGVTNPILSFWYNLNGSDMGSLEVDIYEIASRTWHENVNHSDITGNLGDAWFEKIINLNAYNSAIRIRFRGLTGTSWNSDICIDDVTVKEAPTVPEFATNTDSLNYGEQNILTRSQSKFVLVRNAGGGTLTISSVELVDNDASDFNIITDVSNPVTLAVGETFRVDVDFFPQTTGRKISNLRFTDNIARLTYDVVVTGEGTGENPHYGGGAVGQGGYYFANSTAEADGAPSKPTYNWIDISTTGTNIISQLDDDQLAGPFDIPFNFPYFGQTYNQFKLCSNGWITFDTSFTDDNHAEYEIPDTNISRPNNALYLWWTDLNIDDADNTGSNCYYGTDNIGNFVITFDHFPHIGGDENSWITAQIVLFPNGKIKYQYKEKGSTLVYPAQGLAGIENEDGTKAVQYFYHGGPGELFREGEQIAVAFGIDGNSLGDYTGDFARVSGVVTDVTTTNPIEGIAINLGFASTTTDATGNYVFENIVPGTYNLTATKLGYNPYGPQSLTLAAGADVPNNFTMQSFPTGTISGIITSAVDNSAIENATVTVGNRTATTDSTGAYSISLLPLGSYTVSATAVRFSTETRDVTIDTDGQTITVSLALNLPEGDVIGNAIPVVFDGNNRFNYTGTNVGYNDDYSFYHNQYGVGGKDLVFKLDLPSNATVTLSTAGSTYDTVIGVFAADGAGFTHADTLAYDDDSNAPTRALSTNNNIRYLDTNTNQVTTYRKVNLNQQITSSQNIHVSSSNIDSNGRKTLRNTRDAQSYIANAALDAGRYIVIVDGYVASSTGDLTLDISAPDLVNTTGSISGVVTSALDGNVIANADVTAMRGSVTYTTTTATNGTYSFADTPIGTYSVKADHINFLPNTVNDVVVTADTNTPTNITLEYDPTRLLPPRNLRATINLDDVTLTWDSPATPFAPTGYKLYRDEFTTPIAELSDTTYVDMDLDNANYTYKVQAIYTQGNSDLSAPLEVMVFTYTPEAPVNLAANVPVNTYDVNLTWESPIPVAAALRYDNGNNIAGAGSSSAQDFEVYIRFETSDLQMYNGMYLNSIEFFPKYADCEYSLKVYTGGSYDGTTFVPGNMVADQMVNSNQITVNAWNNIDLTTPLMIDSSEELWIGYRANTQGGNPAGYDAGPAVEGKGNIMYFGGNWTTLSQLASGYNYNWNIAGHINIHSNAVQNVSRGLRYFKIYRDNIETHVDSVLVDNMEDDGTYAWTDHLTVNDMGVHNYEVTSMYDEGESPAATVSAEIVSAIFGDQNAPKVTSLKGNYPNPFNPTTTFAFTVAEPTNVQIDIYNIRGQKVRGFVNKHFTSGNHSLKFDGKTDSGTNLSSGIYFYKMKTARYTSTKKMILLK